MSTTRRIFLAALGGLLSSRVAGPLFGAPQRRRGGRGRGRRGQNDPQFQRDRTVFQYLLANHKQIHREVKTLPNGVETVTESDVPQVAAAIQEHVAAMHRRVTKNQPIRLRDPLFAALFRNAQWTAMTVKATPKGVHVVVTSDKKIVVPLIQAHARVLSAFVKLGFAEARKNHAAPQ
jgi:hypothetical protein